MAEAFLAGLALDTAKTVTNLVKARVLEEIKIAWDFKGNLKKLDKKLFSVQAFLNDLGSARYDIKSSFVNEWLQRFTDVVRSADEFMDDYKYELLCREVERQKKSGSLFRAATQPVVFHFLMSHRIKDILSQFDDLDKEASDAGIKKAKLATQAVASSSAIDESFHQNRKSAAANGAEYIGRKSDEEKLLSKILDSSSEEVHHHLSIVAIVGIGGLGKTTFARNLFNHKKVDDHIDEKIWICVSEHFKVNRILNDMLQYYTPTIPHLENTYAITNALQEKLKGKKLLLVLDDVWESNKNSWSSLRNELLSIRDLRGCVILITTRKIEVADAASAFYKHKLPGLSEDEGWALLKNTTFGESFRYDSSFNGVGRRIVKKCNGVPLAINVIGGVLKSKKFVSEWESIEKNKFWEFHPDDIKDILPSLLLSYNDLNRVYVKQCFAYCAIFPKDFQMEKRQLITLWLAQGFLHDEFAADNSTSTMELVGERYLNILLKCSFFEEEKDKSGVRTWYKMHDLMHDLAAYVSKKNLLIWNAETKAEAISNVQHLAFDAAEKKIPLDRLPIGKLRTISFWGIKQSWNNSTLGRARYMRTLILDGIGLKEVPIIIGKLVHLRYLDLSHNEFVVLPESICKLYQLQTLRVTGCSKLRKLPEELQWLSCLRHIETDNFLLASKGLRQLTNLQTLPPLELRDGDGWTIDELSPLDQVVGELKIRGLRRVKKKEALILRKKKIVKLHLEWDATTSQVLDSDEDALDSNEDVIYNDKDVLVSLKPHPNIQILYIDGFMGLRFPKWIGTTVNLVEVKLIGCRKSNRLPTFGQLPNLKILWLRKFDCLESIGGEFYESGSNISNTREEKVLFPSLTEIKIDHCRRLTTWIPPSPMQTAFPNLEVFHVRKCWKLTEVPVLHYKSLKHPKLFHIGGTQPLDIVKYNHGLWLLDLIGINDMVRLPGELPKCSNLLRLTVGMCEKLEFIPSGLISLKVLLINQCPSLACIPNDLFSLRDLSVQNCELLMSMPHVTSLEMLMISGCPLTASYQQWIPNLHRLQILNTDEWDFNQRTLFPQSLAKLSLTDFSFVKSLPQQPLQYLQSLSLIRFDELVTLPEWIGNLSYLDTLKLEDCKKLKKLPSPQAMQRLSRLHLISIKGCKLLKQTYDREDGPQWLRFVKWA